MRAVIENPCQLLAYGVKIALRRRLNARCSDLRHAARKMRTRAVCEKTFLKPGISVARNLRCEATDSHEEIVKIEKTTTRLQALLAEPQKCPVKILDCKMRPKNQQIGVITTNSREMTAGLGEFVIAPLLTFRNRSIMESVYGSYLPGLAARETGATLGWGIRPSAYRVVAHADYRFSCRWFPPPCMRCPTCTKFV